MKFIDIEMLMAEIHEVFIKEGNFFLLVLWFSFWRGGIAQLTNRPGAMMTSVRPPGAAGDLSPRVSFQCRLSYSARIPP